MWSFHPWDFSRSGHGIRLAGDIRRSQDGDNTRKLFGLAGIDAVDLGVCVDAPQHTHVQHSRELQIIGVGCLAGNETWDLRAV